MQSDDFQKKVAEAIANPRNMGEMETADAVGTVGSPNCGDMVRMWIKFKEEQGRKVIDKATFQTFGCETAIAVASLATEMIRGKTADEALALSGSELASELGPLPPMKIHCGQLVEGALRNALSPAANLEKQVSTPALKQGTTLIESLNSEDKKVKITLLD
ncbi:MAG: iron-sulfur cluster assembly scaffold protein [Verrucomicrobiota bacterium]|nr:iron-sulfur cluster assembly scaffold protein [Verrucomicrobiota bacterium]